MPTRRPSAAACTSPLAQPPTMRKSVADEAGHLGAWGPPARAPPP
jgi:hypothetical protein